MKNKFLVLITIIGSLSIYAQDFDITDTYVKKDIELDQLIFSIEVAGEAGNTVPTPVGDLNGAPVLGYVFPTTLTSTDVGFDNTEGIVALALTSHPDFDDTPLWDENNDSDYGNDGVVWHAHWVLLISDTSVGGGLSVKATSESSILPPTNPGMPMYMDSPGFQVVWSGNKISCAVPLSRMNNQDDFNYDGVTVLMNPETVTIYPNPTSTEVHLDMSSGFGLGDYNVEIYTITSALVYESNINSNSLVIPISEIGVSGTYILNIVDTMTGEVKGSKTIILN